MPPCRLYLSLAHCSRISENLQKYFLWMVQFAKTFSNCKSISCILEMVNLFWDAVKLDVIGTLWKTLMCHSVSTFGNSNGYAKESNDNSKRKIFLMMPLTFENQIKFCSKGGAICTKYYCYTSLIATSLKRSKFKSRFTLLSMQISLLLSSI